MWVFAVVAVPSLRNTRKARYFSTTFPTLWKFEAGLCPRWPQICNPLASVFWVTGITGPHSNCFTVTSLLLYFNIVICADSTQEICNFAIKEKLKYPFASWDMEFSTKVLCYCEMRKLHWRWGSWEVLSLVVCTLEGTVEARPPSRLLPSGVASVNSALLHTAGHAALHHQASITKQKTPDCKPN